MTRNDKLTTMKGSDLIALAERLGVKVACNKAHTQLKEAKQGVIDRIILAEEIKAEAEKVAIAAPTLSVPMTVEYSENGPQLIKKEEEQKDVEKEKVKKEHKPRKKKEVSKDIENLLNFICTEWKKFGIIKTPGKENAVFRPLCVESGRQVVKLMWTTKKISLFVRIEAATEYAEAFQKINYAMPYQCMFYNDNEEVRQNIRNIFELVVNTDSVRHKKEKK